MHRSFLDRVKSAAVSAAVFSAAGPFIGFVGFALYGMLLTHSELRLHEHRDPLSIFGPFLFTIFLGLLFSPLIYKLALLPALLSSAVSGFATSSERPHYFLVMAAITGAATSAIIPHLVLGNSSHPFLRGIIVSDGPAALAILGALASTSCAGMIIAVGRRRRT